MNHFAVIAAAMIPAFCLQQPAAAQQSPALQKELDAANNIFKRWEQRAQGVDNELKRFEVQLPEKTIVPQAPQAPSNGDTAISCESALLFDADNSSLVYVGNVFLQDTRLNLFARNRLYIRMETGVKGDDKKKLSTSSAPATPTSANTGNEAQSNTSTPAETPEATEIKTKQPLNFNKAHIHTYDAVVNALGNWIILSSPAAADPIHLVSEENEIWIRPDDRHPARLVADPEGNIMLSGANISMKWVDKNGTASTIQTHAGILFYHAADATITIPNGGTLTHPDGKISCTKELFASLRKAETTHPKKDGFMQQFMNMKFEGVRSATASGNVYAETNGKQGTLPGKIIGDKLVYDGDTGACFLYGQKCKVVYDKNTIHSNESILLHPNGDVELNGTDIRGQYERPASGNGGAPLVGTFKANANIIFRAASGIVTTEKGIEAKDAETDFSCTGPVRLQLAKGKNAGETKEPAPGMPNLAIANYREVISLSAVGNIIANQYEPHSGKRIGMLRGETLKSDLSTAETTLSGTEQIPAIAEHQGNVLQAKPGKTIPTLHLAANGDIKLTGDTIYAEFQANGGKSTATCKDYLLLTRAANTLQTGSGAVMNSPQGIFTTNRSLYATLLPEKDAKLDTGKFAHLRFNYAGIQEAYTQAGGTMRTVEGSMQCSGPIRITMDTARKNTDKELGSIRRATAAGNVALAGKDSQGRIVKAIGDHLTVDAVSGIKRLTGSRVVLADQYNTHIASGKNAAITIDSQNNARISGERHATVATKIHEQMNKEKPNKK